MDEFPPIIGFRKDRIGARLTGLLNILRLQRKFGHEARFLWLADPGSAWPELADPAAFLARDFIARHVTVIDRLPDLSHRSDLATRAARLDGEHMAQRLRAGERFVSDAAFDVIAFMGEPLPQARAEIAALAASLPLAPRLARALQQAEKRLARRVEGGLEQAAAMHMRRGDLLDGDPWSLTSWAAKFAPDEFLRIWADAQPGAVIVFTDTPAAARQMAAGNDRIMPIDSLLDMDKLSMAERDMLELLIMSRCARIAAAGGSAFSLAAASVGGAEFVPLPQGLAPADRLAAYQALLDRCIDAPDSFFAPGDLAQSLPYAARHAMAQGQAGRLAAALQDREALMQAHPFARRILAECLLADGQQGPARAALERAIADPRLIRADLRHCRGMLSLIEARAAPDSPATAADFLAMAFSQPAGAGLTGQLAALLLARPGPAAQALMFPHVLAADLCDRDESGQAQLPPWFWLTDWEELLDSDGARRPLTGGPALHLKLRRLGPLPRQVDEALSRGEGFRPPQSDTEAQLAGLGAAILSMHGRFARALRILHWLDEARPHDVLTCKRLADTCFRLGNPRRGEELLHQALERAGGEAPLLHLSMARRLGVLGRPVRARRHFDLAAGQRPKDALIRRQGRRLHHDLAAARQQQPKQATQPETNA